MIFKNKFISLAKKIKNYCYKGASFLIIKMTSTSIFFDHQEKEKYRFFLKKDSNPKILYEQIKEFSKSSFNLISNNLNPSDDKEDPIVFVVVKDDIIRIKLFFDHYRKLGVHQFVVLDNGSQDGTLEYLVHQKDTKVYQILEKFQTNKKESWIEKLLFLEGQNHWCVVVDSDELVDFIGSENHSLKELIHKNSQNGLNRLQGYMVDMYSNNTLFSQNNEETSILDEFKYFDKNSYSLCHNKNQNAVDCIFGGPRTRIFESEPTLNKQSIFYYDSNTLYRNSHYLLPNIKWDKISCCFILRHYKFISSDKVEYEKRVSEKTFYNGSIEYKIAMDKYNQNESITMFYEDSEEYKNSNSLKCLPFLEEVFW